MLQASIEWVLARNCHRLICVVQRAEACHQVTVYFDGFPVKSCECRTEGDLQAVVESERAEWSGIGWHPVEPPSSLMRHHSAMREGVMLTPATVVSDD
ncbi:MAG TPA: hypothetical protein VH417_08920 [Vicinamibacterales bacterium]|jgi:hypothetical protein